MPLLVVARTKQSPVGGIEGEFPRSRPPSRRSAGAARTARARPWLCSSPSAPGSSAATSTTTCTASRSTSRRCLTPPPTRPGTNSSRPTSSRRFASAFGLRARRLPQRDRTARHVQVAADRLPGHQGANLRLRRTAIDRAHGGLPPPRHRPVSRLRRARGARRWPSDAAPLPLDTRLRTIARRYLAAGARRPTRLLDKLRFQSVMIIQPADLYEDGHQNMCDGCPDMTVYNGRLVWSRSPEDLRVRGFVDE
jgi:hypothetical protein